MRAAIYTRISDDREGRELGVTRQLQDCRDHADRQGYTIVHVYTDNDRSASRYARKVRPEYRRLIKDARAGKFDVVISYTSARITRQLRENLDLIDLAQQCGITYEYIKSPKHDLNTAEGRKRAKHEAVDNESESDVISERVQRDVDQRAKDARFHGGAPPFGIVAVWSVVDRRERVTGFKLHAEHCKWLKEAAKRVLAGELVYGVCADWNQKGRRTREGKLWSQKTLTNILTSPAAIGKREHNGELHDAPWPAILTERDHTRLVALLSDPERKRSTTNQRRYLLAGLVFCSRCGNRMTSTSLKAGSPPAFECSKTKTGHEGACGGMKVVMDTLEAFVMEQVFFVLDTPEIHRAATADQEDPSEQEEALREAVTLAEEALVSLADEKDDGILTDEGEYRRRRARIESRRDEAKKALLAATRSTVHADLPTGKELRAVWSTKDNTWRRTIVSEVIERIAVGPHPRGVSSAPPRRRGEDETAWRARFDRVRAETLAARLTITWRD